VEWLKVKALSSSPGTSKTTTKKKKHRRLDEFINREGKNKGESQGLRSGVSNVKKSN
jgi:hypothetical protein